MTWNVSTQAYSDCEYCSGTGLMDSDGSSYLFLDCSHCLRRRVNELECQAKRLHKAIAPYIAGGSEYTGHDGLLCAIGTIGERMKTSERLAIKATKARKELESAISEHIDIERGKYTYATPVVDNLTRLARLIGRK